MGNLQILLTTRCCNNCEEDDQDNIPIIEQLPSNLSYHNLKSVESFVTVLTPPCN
jgi:hypothetical protein